LPENAGNEIIETVVLSHSASVTFEEEAPEIMKKVLAEASWDARVEKLVELGQSKNIYSKEYGIMLLNALLNRLKLVINLNIENFPMIDSPAILIRPSEQSVPSMEEDYAVGAFCSQKLDVRFLEGDHMTILDNAQLYDIFNNQIC
jgi:fatty acid synthase, animal type